MGLSRRHLVLCGTRTSSARVQRKYASPQREFGRGRFRGVIASASLKLGLAVRVLVPAVQIPRRDCLGLIEAQRSRPWCGGPPSIPRRDCLGLIEAGRPSRMPLPSSARIPRRDCLGLIEAIGVDPLILSNQPIPRRDCLGLIEARLVDSARVRRHGIPRRDCLGLIEAESSFGGRSSHVG